MDRLALSTPTTVTRHPIRTYVINLAAAKARLAHMGETLGAAGIAWQRFEAVDAQTARSHPAFASIPAMAERGWTPGEIGCLLSHHDVWRLIAAGPDRFGAVLEDDLFIDGRLKAILDGTVTLPRDADLIKLETTGGEITLSRFGRRRNGLAFHRLLSLHYGGGAYILSRTKAAALIGRLDLFDAPLDDALFSPEHVVGGGMTAYQLVPALAVQSVVRMDAHRFPQLRSMLEQGRDAARDIAQAMARATLQEAGARPAAGRPRPLAKAARARSITKHLEIRLVVPFGDGTTPLDAVSDYDADGNLRPGRRSR